MPDIIFRLSSLHRYNKLWRSGNNNVMWIKLNICCFCSGKINLYVLLKHTKFWCQSSWKIVFNLPSKSIILCENRLLILYSLMFLSNTWLLANWFYIEGIKVTQVYTPNVNHKNYTVTFIIIFIWLVTR